MLDGGLKTCTRCKETKPLSAFSKRHVYPYVETKLCKSCKNQRAYEWYKAHPEIRNLKKKRYRDKLRADVLNKYGNQCACCGEKRPEFLTIDHVEGGGIRHLKSIGCLTSGTKFYAWIRRNSYPKMLQILCWNCNCAKGKYGSCPHDRESGQGYNMGTSRDRLGVLDNWGD